VIAGHGCGDPGEQCRAGHVDEVTDLCRRLADEEGPSRVAVPALDDGAGIDRDDLAIADHSLARDPVDDLVVDRDANTGRKGPARVDPGVSLERRGRAGRPDVGFGEAVEVCRRDARLELGLDEREHLGDDAPGPTHPLDLGTRLAGDHGQEAPVGARSLSSSAARIAAVTSSIGWRPSMVRRIPCWR